MWEGLLDRFKVIADADENKIMHDVLENETLQAQIIDLNQKQLYEEGVQTDDTPTGEYALKTIKYKLAFGDARGIPGRIDHITGLNTGKTFASMKCVNYSEEVRVVADDRNGFFEVETHGLGLTEKSLAEIRPEIGERVIDYIREKIR